MVSEYMSISFISTNVLGNSQLVKYDSTCEVNYYSNMNKRIETAESLISNLRYLMDINNMSETQLAKKSGVSQKAVNKIMNRVSSPQLDTLDKIAAVFGLNLWHLIMPGLPDELKSGNSIEKLYSRYIEASPESREYIYHVAEKESLYLPKK